jgi:hypothetical protein
LKVDREPHPSERSPHHKMEREFNFEDDEYFGVQVIDIEDETNADIAFWEGTEVVEEEMEEEKRLMINGYYPSPRYIYVQAQLENFKLHFGIQAMQSNEFLALLHSTRQQYGEFPHHPNRSAAYFNSQVIPNMAKLLQRCGESFDNIQEACNAASQQYMALAEQECLEFQAYLRYLSVADVSPRQVLFCLRNWPKFDNIV